MYAENMTTLASQSLSCGQVFNYDCHETDCLSMLKVKVRMPLVVLIIVALLFAHDVLGQICKSSFTLEKDGSCYFYDSGSKDFYHAKSGCESLNATLAMPKTEVQLEVASKYHSKAQNYTKCLHILHHPSCSRTNDYIKV